MMFKIFRRGTPAKAAGEALSLDIPGREPPSSQPPRRKPLWWRLRLAVAPLLLSTPACRTPFTHIPPANLTEPGWTVHEGQVVWHLPKEGAEIAGEVLLATQPNSRSFVQFTKSPFPLVVGQATATRWEIEFPPQNKHYSGCGTPPKRIIWLYLARALSGKPLPKNWIWKKDSCGWRLENRANREALEGYFNQGGRQDPTNSIYRSFSKGR